jgi:hypothetical protein
MISMIPLLVVAASLATAGILAALKTQRDSAALVARDHAVNTLFDALRADTRAAASTRFLTDEDGSTVELYSAGGRVRYHFESLRVTREQIDGPPEQAVSRTWHLKETVTSVELDAGGPLHKMPLLTVRVHRCRPSKLRLDPLRCLEATFAVGRGYR